MKKKITYGIVIISIIIALMFMSSNFIIDIMWFKEVGYLKVYFTRIFSVLKLFLPIFIVTAAFLFLYSKFLIRDIKNIIGDGVLKFEKWYNVLIAFISVVFSLIVANTYWYTILQFTNSVSFNEKDPFFNKDISFYVFKLPLIQVIFNILLGLVVIISIITMISYAILRIKFNITQANGSSNFKDKSFKSRMAVIAFMIFIMLCVGYILKGYYILYSSRGIVYGAGYTDKNVTLLFYRGISILSGIFAVVSIFFITRNKFKPIIGFVGVTIAIIVLEPIVAQLTQSFFVKPNEFEFEQKYIGYNIDSTRKAFNINNVEEKQFDTKYNLDSKQINENKDIIENLRVNSVSPVLSFYNQVQSMKNYYNFNDIDTDRYNINGKKSQVFVAVRELENSNITSWQNRHLIYTHGYGTVMSKVNAVTSEGQPDFLMKDLPTNNLTDIKVDNPRVYFGEGSNDYIVVNTKINELDYPSSNGNNTTKYNGKAGIRMTPLNRIMLAIREQNSRILFSQDISSDSKMILDKNIVERVKKIAPFLKYDKDPYAVINDGKLYWIMDAYTTSNQYPYSQPYDDINYIRNSVKVIIDAYDGTTNFYIVDDKDPIVQSYSKIFNGLFKSASEIPTGIKEHFRYPEELFNLQCKVLGKYHMTNTTTFFTQDDLWETSSSTMAKEDSKDQYKPNEALYLMTKLPGEKSQEMVLFEYFNVMGKQSMTSLLGARMDGDNYGKLVMYKFPQQTNIYSPYLFNNKILQDKDISKEISLWEGKGSKVLDGDIVIVPINNSLLYLKTIYLKANTQNSIPEVKKIIMSDGDKIVSGNTVAEALEQLFNYKPSDEQTTTSKENNKVSSSDAKQAKDLYDKAIEAQKQGDWAKYGEYIKQLGDLINKLNNKN
ncbi:UPF0182 family protein [Inconstantimicrobium mannanitabidum]|uniref:UPF0182 protein n=1 Tax=Inconstantimicrobium mannanitabidum TaxID=1604901 RepID=A0ACB5RH71_9CLOT|nr:UPF0182 family protein [Clostridium sp. TW13]GKX68427.1 UPF0182 protein [Clostridium sp. TW13]